MDDMCDNCEDNMCNCCEAGINDCCEDEMLRVCVNCEGKLEVMCV